MHQSKLEELPFDDSAVAVVVWERAEIDEADDDLIGSLLALHNGHLPVVEMHSAQSILVVAVAADDAVVAAADAVALSEFVVWTFLGILVSFRS